MRIVTYNFLRAGSLKRCGHWSRVIRSLKPDLLLAQECRPPETSPGERFRHGQRDGFAWQSAGTRDWGSGLFARSASLVPIAIPDYDGWVVGGQIRNTSWLERPFMRGERDILDRLTNEFELVSCWQAANPDRPLAQTLRWTGNPSAPYHCDGIFVPRSWLPLLISCRVVRGSRWKQLSDHNPVVAEFREKATNFIA